MHVPAGGFTRREQAPQLRAVAVVVGAHAAHGIVLRGAHRYQFTHRVNAQEVLADLFHFPQVVVDVLCPQQANIQPQVLPETGGGAVAGGNVFFHAARYHIARGQFFFLGFVVGHETVFPAIQQQAAIAAAALGHQNSRGEDAGGMELYGLHVAQGRDPGLQGDAGAHALVDDGVGGDPVNTPEATGGDAGRPGHVGHQLAAHQVAHDGAVAASPVVNQRQCLHAFVHRDARGYGLVAHGVQHGVTGAIGDIAGAPLLGAAEVAGGDQAVGCVGLGDGLLFAIHGDLALTALHPVPGHTPGRQFAYRLGSRVGEHAYHFLVRAPVAAAHRIGEMNVLVVARCPQAIAETGLHAALGGGGVGALGRNQAEYDDFLAAAPGADGGALARQATTDYQHVCVDGVHSGLSLPRARRRRGSARQRGRRGRSQFSCKSPGWRFPGR